MVRSQEARGTVLLAWLSTLAVKKTGHLQNDLVEPPRMDLGKIFDARVCLELIFFLWFKIIIIIYNLNGISIFDVNTG